MSVFFVLNGHSGLWYNKTAKQIHYTAFALTADESAGAISESSLSPRLMKANNIQAICPDGCYMPLT